MPRIRNISPWGALDVPLLGRTVDAGEEVDVEAEEAGLLLDQPLNWESVEPGAAPTAATSARDARSEASVDVPTPEAPEGSTEPHTTPEGSEI